MKALRMLAASVLVAAFLAPLAGLAADTKSEKKLKPYPLKTCMISGEKLGGMGDAYVYEYQGREIKFCCQACQVYQDHGRGRGKGRQEGQELGFARLGTCFQRRVKPLLAILFSLALVWAQSVPARCVQSAAAGVARSACKCCHCGGASCCMKKTAPNPQPMPAAPAPTSSQQLQLLSLAPAPVAFVLPSAASSPFSATASAPVRAAALPLYQQNCILLL